MWVSLGVSYMDVPSRIRYGNIHLGVPTELLEDSGPHVGHPSAYLHNHLHTLRPSCHNCTLSGKFGKLFRFHIEAYWEPVNV